LICCIIIDQASKNSDTDLRRNFRSGKQRRQRSEANLRVATINRRRVLQYCHV
jgi:hypothetical protein